MDYYSLSYYYTIANFIFYTITLLHYFTISHPSSPIPTKNVKKLMWVQYTQLQAKLDESTKKEDEYHLQTNVDERRWKEMKNGWMNKCEEGLSRSIQFAT